MAGRAAAATGQSGLMALYDSLFGMMDLQGLGLEYAKPRCATAMAGRAAAATGQSGLMALYDSLFGMMDLQAAQVLVTLPCSLGTCCSVAALLQGCNNLTCFAHMYVIDRMGSPIWIDMIFCAFGQAIF